MTDKRKLTLQEASAEFHDAVIELRDVVLKVCRVPELVKWLEHWLKGTP